MIRARCITPCIWLRQFWPAGTVYEGTETPPEHFVILETPPETPEHEDEGKGCNCGHVTLATNEEVTSMLEEVFNTNGP